MVSNLQQMAGVVRLDPVSEQTELYVTFNADQTSMEAIIARLKEGDEEVTGWKMVE